MAALTIQALRVGVVVGTRFPISARLVAGGALPDSMARRPHRFVARLAVKLVRVSVVEITIFPGSGSVAGRAAANIMLRRYNLGMAGIAFRRDLAVYLAIVAGIAFQSNVSPFPGEKCMENPLGIFRERHQQPLDKGWITSRIDHARILGQHRGRDRHQNTHNAVNIRGRQALAVQQPLQAV